MEAGVSAYVVKGLAEDRVRSVVDVAVAHFNRYHSMREELDRARLSLVERKTVDRAKGLLMEQKGLSEEAAYRLRKLAMDQNKRIGEVAQDIVTYAKALKSCSAFCLLRNDHAAHASIRIWLVNCTYFLERENQLSSVQIS